jgi:hypothetical protein
MINKQLLQEIESQTIISGFFKMNLESPIISGEYSIEKNLRLDFICLNGPDHQLGKDQPGYILGYTEELLDKNFGSILVAGLGLGMVPYVVQDFCSVIDVLEIEQDIINCINQLGHLDDKVNIMHGDALTYVPERKYDVILHDIWYHEIPDEMTDQIIEQYRPYLNDGGFIYIPINHIKSPNKLKIYK